ANMVQDSQATWDGFFGEHPNAYGFEGLSPASDGYHELGATGGTYVTDVQLMGTKSFKFHSQGAWPAGPGGLGNHAAIDPRGTRGDSGDLWIRFYCRWNLIAGAWPTNYLKVIDSQGGPVNQYYLDIAGASGGQPQNFNATYDSAAHDSPIPGGALKNNRWYTIELHWKSTTPRAYELWVDGVQLERATPSMNSTVQYLLFGIINLAGTQSSFSLDSWFDGLAFGPSRVYPASTIEVSGDGVDWKYQEPMKLSDTSAQIKLDLTGLTGTSYRLRVTNNQQQTSAVYILSGGSVDALPPTRSNGSPSGTLAAGTASATVSLATNEGATCRYSTQAGTAFTSMNGAFLSTGGTSHSFEATGLANGRSYSYYVRCRDAAGNANPDDYLVSFSVASGGTPGQTGTLLFAEGFDDASLAARGWYDNTNIFISTSEHVAGSAGSAQFQFNQGATAPSSGGAMRKLFAPTDTLYMSYWLKYDPSWQDQATFGHHEILLLTDQNDPWSNLAFTRLTAYVESWGTPGQSVPVTPHVSFQDGQNIDQAKIGVDLTQVTEARAACGCNGVLDAFSATCYDSGAGVYWNGKSLSGGAVLSPGQWRHVEVFIKLNSIVNGKGVADGVVTYWLDGQQVFSSSKASMRTGQHPTMKFNQFVIAPWMGNGSPKAQSLWLDKLEVWNGMPNGTAKPLPPMNLRVR
ncbi:MAG: hypothetical protein HY901_38245, partial [Deltaproteobacteria bacterium]|nr:hypothetical protein [Deltaproteobacteria bacterium]